RRKLLARASLRAVGAPAVDAYAVGACAVGACAVSRQCPSGRGPSGAPASGWPRGTSAPGAAGAPLVGAALGQGYVHAPQGGVQEACDGPDDPADLPVAGAEAPGEVDRYGQGPVHGRDHPDGGGIAGLRRILVLVVQEGGGHVLGPAPTDRQEQAQG